MAALCCSEISAYLLKAVAYQRVSVRYIRSTICVGTSESSGRDASSIEMAYTSHESTKTLSGPQNVPIIIMHGLLGSRNNWSSLSKAIHNITLRKIIAVDARNHGDSPHSSEFSYHHLAEDVRGFMEIQNIPKATLIGHSMGGRAMMLAALKYPSLVEKLVVVDISPVGNSPSLHVMRTYFDAMKNIKINPNVPLSSARKVVDEQLQSVISDPMLRLFLTTNLVEDNGNFRWRVNLDSISQNFTANIASFPLNGLSPFEGPTLFVCGGNSDYVRAEDHPQVKRYFPNAIFETVPDAGHWVHSEKPSMFIDIVCHFLLE